MHIQDLTLAFARLAGASKSQIRASILKEITVAQIGQAKSVLCTYEFQYQKLTFSFWGK